MPPISITYKLCVYQGNTTQIFVQGLQDQNGDYANDAVDVLATLVDENRSVVPQCVNIPLAYVTSSNGDYLGTIAVPFTPPVGTEYTMIIDGDSGSSHIHMEVPTEVKVRVN